MRHGIYSGARFVTGGIGANHETLDGALLFVAFGLASLVFARQIAKWSFWFYDSAFHWSEERVVQNWRGNGIFGLVVGLALLIVWLRAR